VVVLAVCAYGAHQRNEVWRTEETLWRDVAEKSPRNGRGWMNYGLTQMAKGDYNSALASFNKALPLTPNYSLLHINIAIADGAMGRDADAQREFAYAIALAPDDSNSYYFFARWLSQHGQTAQAMALAETAIQKNPLDLPSRQLLLQLYAGQNLYDKLNALLADSLKLAPNDPDLLRFRNLPPVAQGTPAVSTQTPEALLSLSLSEYQAGRYRECIDAAQQALRLNPKYAEAYNNIAAAWNALGRYDEGIRAAEEALRLKPDFELARNNLAWAKSQLAHSRHH
jgi:tetratricopeptide (TPR) repeat protein